MHSQIRWSMVLTVVFLTAQSALAGGYTLTVSPDQALPGEILVVSWTAPAGGTTDSDWIALYHVGNSNSLYMDYQYTGGETTGSLNFTAPNAVGLFEFRYLLNGGYTYAAVGNTLEVSRTRGAGVTGPRVLMLSGGQSAADSALASVLEDRGLDVTIGPAVPSWDGTQFDLSEFAAVAVPHNFNWTGALQGTGIAALADFVLEGGGLVTGEWSLWGAFSRRQASFLTLVPVEDYCGYNHAVSTTYSRATRDSVIHDGLPPSFNFPLANIGGTESCFGARPEAKVFFTSSNGGGQADADGLVGWSYGRGRVASFSTLLSGVELANADYARLVGNTVVWASQSACTAEAVTPANLAAFVSCLTGPGVGFEAGCELRDLDCNGRIDLRDVAFLQRTFDVP